MIVDWKRKTFGAVATIYNGNSISKKEKEENYVGNDHGTSYIATKDVGFDYQIDYDNGVSIPEHKSNEFKIAPPKSVFVCAEGGSSGKKIAHNDRRVHFGNKLYAIVPNTDTDSKYLFYYCISREFFEAFSGVRTGLIGGVSLSKFKNLMLPLPPLSEQKRIVAILDEAFAGISQAVVNVEKNLTNVRELFESYLNGVFARKGEGWVEKTFREITTLLGDGLHGTPKYTDNGEYHFINGNNLNNGEIVFKARTRRVSFEEYGKYKKNLNERTVFVSINGTLGNVAFYNNEKIILGKSACYFNLIKGIDKTFIKYAILSPQFKKYMDTVATGTTIKNVSLESMRNYQLYLPTHTWQQAITKKLDVLSAEINNLESIYQQKLTALTELKQSILQKAFEGELTASLKRVEVETTSPEFAANVLAFAYYRHVLRKREKTFGHVKAQKILHLVESIGGIDLGRKPIKDAAGPNDFPHMINVEEWAKANQLFEFVSIGKGYEFKKLSHYNSISKTFSAIRPYQKKLEKIVDLLIPMKTEEAEVLATVHAAWNELVFKGDEFDDSKIIYEARDNWHPDKMKIPISRFRKAIRFIRDNKLVPDGKAKRLSGQEQMF